MRVFAAVELPEAVRAAVSAAFDTSLLPLLAPFGAVRPVSRENLHVTVRFLGETAPESLPAVREALASAAAAVGSSTAQVCGFGTFPSLRAPRVAWAGIDDPRRTIAALEREITSRIAPLGFRPEGRPYTAHVTMARLPGAPRGRRRPSDRGRVPAPPLVLPPAAPLGPEFPVGELTLFVSELSPRGPSYRALDRFPLAVRRG